MTCNRVGDGISPSIYTRFKMTSLPPSPGGETHGRPDMDSRTRKMEFVIDVSAKRKCGQVNRRESPTRGRGRQLAAPAGGRGEPCGWRRVSARSAAGVVGGDVDAVRAGQAAKPARAVLRQVDMYVVAVGGGAEVGAWSSRPKRIRSANAIAESTAIRSARGASGEVAWMWYSQPSCFSSCGRAFASRSSVLTRAHRLVFGHVPQLGQPRGAARGPRQARPGHGCGCRSSASARRTRRAPRCQATRRRRRVPC